MHFPYIHLGDDQFTMSSTLMTTISVRNRHRLISLVIFTFIILIILIVIIVDLKDDSNDINANGPASSVIRNHFVRSMNGWSDHSDKSQSINYNFYTKNAHVICHLAAEAGNCTNRFIRYHYSHKKRKCIEFIYRLVKFF